MFYLDVPRTENILSQRIRIARVKIVRAPGRAFPRGRVPRSAVRSCARLGPVRNLPVLGQHHTAVLFLSRFPAGSSEIIGAWETGVMKQLRFCVLFCLFASRLLAVLTAQTNPAESPAAASPATSSSAAATESKAEEPGAAQSGAAADTIVEYAPPPAEYARAKAYSNARYRHMFIGAFYGFLILLVILRWRVTPSFRNLAERVSAHRSIQVIVF